MSADRFPPLLAGLKVVELAAVLAGPSAGTFLAELGAEVVKVEPPGDGDVTRSWKLAAEDPNSPVSAYYASVNSASKEVIQADLKNPERRAEILDLILESDIVLTSFRPGSGEKMGLDPDSLSKLRPNLIVGAVSGFGPQSGRAAYDMVVQAEAGFLFMTGSAGSDPVKIPVALMDVLASHQLKEGILLALLQRERTGTGAIVEVSLIDAAVSALANQASNYLMTGHIPGPMGSLHPNIAPYGEQFECADEKVLVLAVGSDLQFVRLCRVLGIAEKAEDSRFRRNPDRVVHRAELQEILRQEFRREPRDRWIETLIREDIPAGSIRSLDEVFSDPVPLDLVRRESIEGMDTSRVSQAVFRIRTPFEN